MSKNEKTQQFLHSIQVNEQRCAPHRCVDHNTEMAVAVSNKLWFRIIAIISLLIFLTSCDPATPETATETDDSPSPTTVPAESSDDSPGAEQDSPNTDEAAVPTATLPATAVPTPVSTPTPQPLLDTEQLVGQTGGTASALAVANNYVFTTLGRRLIVVDIANPTAPELVARGEPLPHWIARIDMIGDTLILGGAEGLTIFDISDPKNPEKVSDWEGRYDSFLTFGNVILSFQSGRLSILDVSNPGNPTHLSDLAIEGNVSDYVVVGERLFANTLNDELLTIDISNPGAPVLIGTAVNVPAGRQLAIFGNFAYLTGPLRQNTNDSLFVYDISDPNAANLVSNQPLVTNFPSEVTRFITYDIQIQDDGIALVTGEIGTGLESRVLTFNLGENPGNPRKIAELPFPGKLTKMQLYANYLVTVNHSGGFELLDVQDPLNITPIGSFSLHWAARDIIRHQDFLVISNIGNGQWGYVVVDISDPTEPEAGQLFLQTEQVVTMSTSDEYLFLFTRDFYNDASYQKIRILDINTLPNPVEVGVIELSKHAYIERMHYEDGLLYVQDEGKFIEIYDITQPTPVSLTFYYFLFLDTQLISFQKEGNFIYMVTDPAYGQSGTRALRITDFTDPLTPLELAEYPLPARPFALEMLGNFAIVAFDMDGSSYEADIMILDVSDPENIQEIGTYQRSEPPFDMWVSDTYVFMRTYVNSFSGMEIIDVSDPTQPELIVGIEKSINDYELTDEHIFLAVGTSGLEVFEWND